MKDIPLPINELYDAVGQLSKIVGGERSGRRSIEAGRNRTYLKAAADDKIQINVT